MSDPMSVTMEEAYQEACLALGEAIVRERLLTRALQQGAPAAPLADDTTGAPPT